MRETCVGGERGARAGWAAGGRGVLVEGRAGHERGAGGGGGEGGVIDKDVALTLHRLA